MISQKQINDFLAENCIIERAKIFKNIKDNSTLSYEHLSIRLYESVRNLKRLYKLNFLIPEIQYLVKVRKIKKVVAYYLSSFPDDEQMKIYDLFKDKFGQGKLKDDLQYIEDYQNDKEKYIENSIHIHQQLVMNQLIDELEQQKYKDIKKMS